LGDRLLPAYNTPSGIPYPKVNLATGKGSYYNVRGKVSLAEVGTLQLEMRELSRLTKDPKYWQAAKRADDVVAGMKTFDGLLPTTFKPPIPGFDMLDYTMGAVADSYYEYLLKRWLQSGKTDNSLRKRYDDAILGMRKHLIKVSSRNHYVFSGDLSDDGKFSPRMQHLTCFIGATLALGSVNGNADAARAKNDLTLAADITRTCNAMYTNMPTSLSPEFVYIREPFTSNINEDTNPVADNDMTTVTRANYNILRPETLESLFLMWYTTRDVKYR
jgi:mannosyl-oligosaccharide alpha-1,2-mannosidase